MFIYNNVSLNSEINVSDNAYIENQNTHFIFNCVIENVLLGDNVCENMALPDKSPVTILSLAK
jgi:hypothetical protein